MRAKTVALMFPPSLQQVITDAEWSRLQTSLFVAQTVSTAHSHLCFPITAAALSCINFSLQTLLLVRISYQNDC